MTPESVVGIGAIALVALVTGIIAAVAGFGGAVLLLPMLVWTFGVHDAVPIFAVAQLVGNSARAWFNRADLDLDVVRWFAIGAVPLAIVGAMAFAAAPAPLLQRLLGVFLIGAVVFRHSRPGGGRIGLRAFALIGLVFGFLSGLVGTVGPLMAPFFLAYGLMKGAYIGTEALATLVMRVISLAVYGSSALLTEATLAIGLLIGIVLLIGAYVGRRILDRVPERIFPLLIELVLVVSGTHLLVFG